MRPNLNELAENVTALRASKGFYTPMDLVDLVGPAHTVVNADLMLAKMALILTEINELGEELGNDDVPASKAECADIVIRVLDVLGAWRRSDCAGLNINGMYEDVGLQIGWQAGHDEINLWEMAQYVAEASQHARKGRGYEFVRSLVELARYCEEFYFSKFDRESVWDAVAAKHEQNAGRPQLHQSLSSM